MPFLRVAGQHHPYHHQYRRDPLSGELRYCAPGFPPDSPLEYRRGLGHSDELFCLSPSTPGFGTHLGNPDTIKYDIPTAIPGSWIATGAHAAATSAAAPPAQFWAKPPRKDEPGIPWVAEMKRGAWHAHHNARHILPQGGPASPWSPGLWRPGGVPCSVEWEAARPAGAGMRSYRGRGAKVRTKQHAMESWPMKATEA